MIDSIAKLLPLMTLVGGGVASKDKISLQVEKVIHYTEIVAVQSEINDLAKIAYLDFTTDGRASLNIENFADYCRKNLLAKEGSNRDTSKDFWGTEYKLEISEKKFRIVSAGPDRQFGTDDDVISGYRLD